MKFYMSIILPYIGNLGLWIDCGAGHRQMTIISKLETFFVLRFFE
jgi:hypothetical protein